MAPEEEKVRVLSCHKCRHSFGTYAIRSGIPMRVLQQLLGHAQITTTEIYTNVDISDLQDSAKKLSFKG